MQISPLQLKQHFFTKLAIDQRDKSVSSPRHAPIDFNNVSIGTNLEFGLATNEQEDPRHFVVRLGLNIDEKKESPIPYDISLEVLGIFEVASSVPVEKRMNLVVINGSAILYGAAREMLNTLSSRFMHGTVILPTVNFVDLEQPPKRKEDSGNPVGAKA